MMIIIIMLKKNDKFTTKQKLFKLLERNLKNTKKQRKNLYKPIILDKTKTIDNQEY